MSYVGVNIVGKTGFETLRQQYSKFAPRFHAQINSKMGAEVFSTLVDTCFRVLHFGVCGGQICSPTD